MPQFTDFVEGVCVTVVLDFGRSQVAPDDQTGVLKAAFVAAWDATSSVVKLKAKVAKPEPAPPAPPLKPTLVTPPSPATESAPPLPPPSSSTHTKRRS